MRKTTNKKIKEEHPILRERSIFSTMKVTGGGVHKSEKDYNRKNNKRKVEKEVKKYFNGDY